MFNQSLCLYAIGGVVTLILGFTLLTPYMQAMAADAATVDAGRQYLLAFMPALALQFALLTLASALRGTGVGKPGMLIQIGTVVLNAILAPVLIAGWGTGHPMGTFGAGLASLISVASGVVDLFLARRSLREARVGVDRTAARDDHAIAEDRTPVRC